MRRVYDAQEFARRANPQALADSIDAIEQWREENLEFFTRPEDEGSRIGIHLQAHLRHTIAAFSLAQPAETGIVANATLTALAHCAALVLAEGESRGFPRENGIRIMLERINAVVDDELERDEKKRGGYAG